MPMAKLIAEIARMHLRTRFISASSRGVAALSSGAPSSTTPRVRLSRRIGSRAGPALGHLLQLLLQFGHFLLKLTVFLFRLFTIRHGQNISLKRHASAHFIHSTVGFRSHGFS